MPAQRIVLREEGGDAAGAVGEVFGFAAGEVAVIRIARKWTVTAPSSANSACARKPSVTGRRRKSGRSGIANGR